MHMQHTMPRGRIIYSFEKGDFCVNDGEVAEPTGQKKSFVIAKTEICYKR